MSHLVARLVAARTQLTASNNATVALKDALLTDNGEAITQALKLAEAAQLESPLVQEVLILIIFILTAIVRHELSSLDWLMNKMWSGS